jgi:pimeloyl-ACP methyl ester carboxylesterase
MGRGWKILIGVVVALGVLLALNTVVVDHETKGAEVTVPGGRILHLQGGDMQVVDKGPRNASPIVLIHCFTCAIDWWDGMIPWLDRTHRVIALDLRGYGGSEKPSSGYSTEDQASFVAEALNRLGVRHATVVGHSLGGTVATALNEDFPPLVARLVIIDQAPDESYESGGLPFTAKLTFMPVLGQALWQVTPDFAIKDGLGAAFAPGFDVPDRFVDDFNRMTYTSYSSDTEEGDYSNAVPLDRRIARTGTPLLAIFGAEDQIYDSKKAVAAYVKVPGAHVRLIGGAGHSPNVEKAMTTAWLVLAFLHEPPRSVGSEVRGGVVSLNGSQRQQERDKRAQSNATARRRNRASGAGGAAGGQ